MPYSNNPVQHTWITRILATPVKEWDSLIMRLYRYETNEISDVANLVASLQKISDHTEDETIKTIIKKNLDFILPDFYIWMQVNTPGVQPFSEYVRDAMSDWKLKIISY